MTEPEKAADVAEVSVRTRVPVSPDRLFVTVTATVSTEAESVFRFPSVMTLVTAWPRKSGLPSVPVAVVAAGTVVYGPIVKLSVASFLSW